MKPMSEWTKDEFLDAHRLTWQGLIDWLKTIPYKEITWVNFINKKYELSESIAGEPVYLGCFACKYSVSTDDICRHCLFGNFRRKECLGGLYEDLRDALDEGELEEAVKIAMQIRDLPARED